MNGGLISPADDDLQVNCYDCSDVCRPSVRPSVCPSVFNCGLSRLIGHPVQTAISRTIATFHNLQLHIIYNNSYISLQCIHVFATQSEWLNKFVPISSLFGCCINLEITNSA